MEQPRKFSFPAATPAKSSWPSSSKRVTHHHIIIIVSYLQIYINYDQTCQSRTRALSARLLNRTADFLRFCITAVLPNVPKVRGWHARMRAEAIPTLESRTFAAVRVSGLSSFLVETQHESRASTTMERRM